MKSATATSVAPIDQGGKDLCPIRTERPSRCRRATGEVHRKEREPQRSCIRQHMAGVCDQGQRVRKQPPDHFDGHVDDHQRERHR